MMRSLAAVAALGVLPVVAFAQPSATQFPGRQSEVVVHAPPPTDYSIVINVAGKTSRTVHSEIWDAAYKVCARAPITGNEADRSIDGSITCVNHAQSDAVDQYRQILQRL
jgi:hypothetical protein